MINMTDESRNFLKKYLPQKVNAKDVNDILDSLYDLIDLKGFNENDEYNDFGREAQRVYDDLYLNN